MEINKSALLEIIHRTLTSEQIEGSLIYWYKRILKEGESINISPQIPTMPFAGVIVFVDLAPRANWTHPCLYMLVDIKTLNTTVIESSLPPAIDSSDENYIIILRYGQSPPHERYFSAFDT